MRDGDDIAQGGATRARHDSDTPRISGQVAFALGGEESFARQLRDRHLDRLAPQSITCRFDATNPQLKLTFAGIEIHLHLSDDFHSIVRRSGNAVLIATPYHALHLRVVIAKTEIPVSVLVLLEVGDFAADPERSERLLDEIARSIVQLADRDCRFTRRSRQIDRLYLSPPRITAMTRVAAWSHANAFAALTVFERSIAIVIGPTPPGTGVIFAATCLADSKSTSPTRR